MSDRGTPDPSAAEFAPKLLIQDRLRGRGLRLAPLIRRLAARSVDGLLKTIIVVGTAIPMWPAAFEHIQQKTKEAEASGKTTTVWLIDRTTGALLGELILVALLVGVLYEVLPTAKWGRTIGKGLFGLTVVDVETMRSPNFRRATRRYLTRLALNVVVIGFFVGPLWTAIDHRLHQGWHDKAGRTCVVWDHPAHRRKLPRNHLRRLGGPLTRWLDKPVTQWREQVRAWAAARADDPESRQPLDLMELSDRPETTGAADAIEVALERVFQALGPPPEGLSQDKEPVVHGGGGNAK
jgi:uncharacterized RDD family membrane protein YckC